ncbi:hypothetical protein F5887DRAFT_977823 [Amanita rubescens]|nr:hypothetical protein F5887DRAFT_977823 [Amanita rubescens]
MGFSPTIPMALLFASATLALLRSFQTEERGDKICWHACSFEPLERPPEFHPQNIGECHVCYRRIPTDGES